MSDFTDGIDLANERLGGAAIAANDDFFAEKENLVRQPEAVFDEHRYTDRGKWMDGWETRRRREPGYDWCVVRLGLPGAIAGVVVDTAFFRGNYPEACSIDACDVDSDAAALADDAPWTEILSRAALQGDSVNPFAIASMDRATHVRLNIYPDGGVARLRVYGTVLPDWAALLAGGEPIDLAAVQNGGVVTDCSDNFFSSRHNLNLPGDSLGMFDGWETKRRRGPGHDWVVVQLGRPGTLSRAVVDTSHFKGNAPGWCSVEVRGDDFDWREVLPKTALQPHQVHDLDGLTAVPGATHARLNIYPDGGVARLRLFGTCG